MMNIGGSAITSITHVTQFTSITQFTDAAPNQPLRLLDAPGGPERCVFGAVEKGDFELAAVPEIPLDLVGQVVHGSDDLGHAVALEEREDMLHDRAVADRHQRLGPIRGHGPQSRPLSPCHDDGFHADSL